MVESMPADRSGGVVRPGDADGEGMVAMPNVDVLEEMVDMITTQRAYEMNAKVVSAADDMLKFVSQSM